MVWLALDFLLFIGIVGLVVYGLIVADLTIVLKIGLSLLFAAKEVFFLIVMRNDRHMKVRYIIFFMIDIAVLVVGIYCSSVPMVIASAVTLSMTTARIAYFIRRNKTGK